MKVNIITLGCSKNTVDSENIAGILRNAGHNVYFDKSSNDCDITVINTCGFIGDAKEESINAIISQIQIKTAGRKQRKLVVAGCLVERYKNELQKELPEVDAWFGTHEWDQLIQFILSAPTSGHSIYGVPLSGNRILSTPRHYAYIKISEGCNRSCSYCAIPHIRGHHKSRPIQDIIDESKRMVACGVKELIVIAQDTTFYGLDIYGHRSLAQLLERLATESGAEWIRLHYAYPASFPIDVLDVMARHENICNYLDIPLQHINTGILASMQRSIGREETLQLLDTIRAKVPGIAIRTTLIVGYPTESDASFNELLNFVEQARFERLGAFIYSQEENTPAEQLGDPIPPEIKQQRLDTLMALQDKIASSINTSLIGQTVKVLIDRKEADYFIGRTQYDSPEVDNEVLITTSSDIKVGSFYNVRITQAYEHDLMAEPL